MITSCEIMLNITTSLTDEGFVQLPKLARPSYHSTTASFDMPELVMCTHSSCSPLHHNLKKPFYLMLKTDFRKRLSGMYASRCCENRYFCVWVVLLHKKIGFSRAVLMLSGRKNKNLNKQIKIRKYLNPNHRSYLRRGSGNHGASGGKPASHLRSPAAYCSASHPRLPMPPTVEHP